VIDVRRVLERTLLVAGLIGLNVWVWSNFRTAVSQRQALRELQGRMEKRDTAPAPSPAKPSPKPVTGDLLGSLEVPRLHLQAAVREGDNAGTLSIALGHIPGTAFPGEKGNVGVAGHRDALFRGLKNIEKNDVIRFQTLEGTYLYQVESTAIVKPDRVDVLNPGKEPEITLVTCYPFNYVGSAPQRFIVKARQLPSAAMTTPPAKTVGSAPLITTASARAPARVRRFLPVKAVRRPRTRR
jgi:sortase A